MPYKRLTEKDVSDISAEESSAHLKELNKVQCKLRSMSDKVDTKVSQNNETLKKLLAVLPGLNVPPLESQKDVHDVDEQSETKGNKKKKFLFENDGQQRHYWGVWKKLELPAEKAKYVTAMKWLKTQGYFDD